jgi:hypothetical protein
MRFMVGFLPLGRSAMNDLLVVRTTKRARLLRSRLKLIAAHLWLAGEWAQPGEIDFTTASAIVKGLIASQET